MNNKLVTILTKLATTGGSSDIAEAKSEILQHYIAKAELEKAIDENILEEVIEDSYDFDESYSAGYVVANIIKNIDKWLKLGGGK